MKFGEQIKRVRKDRNLTQQEMADKLCLSRQAISNWENDKNLPDIEMLITISRVFQITLDELILGGTQMNNMTEKLIADGSRNAQIRMNLKGIKIGSILLVLSFISLMIGIWGPVPMENYFGTAFTAMMLCGVITFLVIGIKNMMDVLKKRQQNSFTGKIIAIGGVIVSIGILIYIASLITELISGLLGFVCIAIGIILIIVGALTATQATSK